MSYNLPLPDLVRSGHASLTQQLVDHVVALIDDGRLEPGARLPASRTLAARAGVNPLTAARTYRRLAELGYVTTAVGRGTFVRRRMASTLAADNDEWQLDVLPQRPPTYADRMLRASLTGGMSEETISLAIGFPDPELSPGEELARIAAAAARQAPTVVTDYTEVEGAPALRERLGQLGRQWGFAAGPEEVLVTSGARQGIDLVARALLAPGDVAAVESPTFAGTLGSLQGTGAQVVGLPVDDEGLDVTALERLLARHEIKLVALQPACQNPTGTDLSARRRERLLELARTRGFFVMEDGVYATMRYEGEESLRLRAGAPSHVIYVDSLSKSIGGGLRVGWIAAAGPVFDRLVQLKLASDIHTATLPQHLATQYLAGDRHRRLLARALPVYRRRRDALLAALERHLADEATWTAPVGGHHVWVTLRSALDEHVLYTEALHAGVMVLPGGALQVGPTAQTSVRLSFSLAPPEQHDEAVRRLATAIRATRRRQPAPATTALS